MRITQQGIKDILDSDNANLFTHRHGLRVYFDVPEDENANSEGVYLGRPEVSISPQVVTVDHTGVYDETTELQILFIARKKQKNINTARLALEQLVLSSDYNDFHSVYFECDETSNESNLTFDYTFTFERTIVN
jgi:hypothetical protein